LMRLASPSPNAEFMRHFWATPMKKDENGMTKKSGREIEADHGYFQYTWR